MPTITQYPEYPGFGPRPAYRYAAATAFTSAQVLTWYVPISGSAKVLVRMLTATTGGTVTFAYGYMVNDTFTAYTTGNAANMTMVAGTENSTALTPSGENWLRLQFTAGAGSGTVTFLDVAQV